MQNTVLSTNKKLKESLKLNQNSLETPVDKEHVVVTGGEFLNSSNSSITDELKAKKKSKKKPARIPCMTHLYPEVNQKIEDLVEQSGLSKSQVIEYLVQRSLSCE